MSKMSWPEIPEGIIGITLAIAFILFITLTQGCTSTLKAGDQEFHFEIQVPVAERMIEGTTPQYWTEWIKDTTKKVETDESKN